MNIYRPVETNILTQRFGANSAYYDPKTGDVSSVQNAGYVPFYEYMGMKGHNGDDLKTWHGEPVYFPVCAGVKWYSKEASDLSGGLGVDVFSQSRVAVPVLPPQMGEEAKQEWRENNGELYVKFRFWHLKEGWKDKNVTPGDKIGLADNTGSSSGDHLHWCLKFVNVNGRTLDTGNGYMGAVDMRATYMYEDRFILDAQSSTSVLSLSDRLRKLKLHVKQLI